MTDKPNDKKTSPSDGLVTTRPEEATKPLPEGRPKLPSWKGLKDCDGEDFKRL